MLLIRYRHIVSLSCLTVSALTSSCAPVIGNSPSVKPGAPPVLSEAEISAAMAITAYEVVERLRPRFLRSGGGEAFQPTVYVDGQLFGGIAELRLIPAMTVSEIRFLTPVEATATYGTRGRAGAAIAITIKRAR
jgi:hypothetical protein